MPVSIRFNHARRTALRTLRDPLGIGRFRPRIALEPEDLPGLDRENRLHA